MDLKPLVLLLWIFSGPVLSFLTTRVYWYHSTPRPWEKAHEFCWSEYSGSLATAVTDTDLTQMDLTEFQAWVGLKNKTGSGWQWVSGDNFGDKFAEGEPESGEECGKVIRLKTEAYGDKCDQKHFVFCETFSGTVVFVPETKTWSEGEDHCKKNNGEYLKRSSVSDPRDFPVWIGLRHDGQDWKWRDGVYSDYRNWASGSDPGRKYGADSCVAVSSQSKYMSVQNCSEAFPFLCYQQNIVLVQELLTWEQALETCRNLNPNNHSSFRMVSVELNELAYVLSHAQGATTPKVWVGLRFLGGSWFWTDGSAVSLSLPQCPKSGLHCGALVLGQGRIEPSDCSQRFNVLCYREP